jgi:hypothetical protein
MLSRWFMTERTPALSGADGESRTNRLLQVQYAFVELPKLPSREPDTGAMLWAWLFVHAPELQEIPSDLPPGPHREALELANEARFTQAERDAYRKVMDEIQQARDYGAAQRAEGFSEGEARGEIKGKREDLLALMSHAGIALSDEDRARVRACTDVDVLRRWLMNVLGAKSSADVFR